MAFVNSLVNFLLWVWVVGGGLVALILVPGELATSGVRSAIVAFCLTFYIPAAILYSRKNQVGFASALIWPIRWFSHDLAAYRLRKKEESERDQRDRDEAIKKARADAAIRNGAPHLNVHWSATGDMWHYENFDKEAAAESIALLSKLKPMFVSWLKVEGDLADIKDGGIPAWKASELQYVECDHALCARQAGRGAESLRIALLPAHICVEQSKDGGEAYFYWPKSIRLECSSEYQQSTSQDLVGVAPMDGHWEHQTKSGEKDNRYTENRRISKYRIYCVVLTLEGDEGSEDTPEIPGALVKLRFAKESDRDGFLVLMRRLYGLAAVQL